MHKLMFANHLPTFKKQRRRQACEAERMMMMLMAALCNFMTWKSLVEAHGTYIKSGRFFNVEHLLTNAQNAMPSRHDVVMLSTRTFL